MKDQKLPDSLIIIHGDGLGCPITIKRTESGDYQGKAEIVFPKGMNGSPFWGRYMYDFKGGLFTEEP